MIRDTCMYSYKTKINYTFHKEANHTVKLEQRKIKDEHLIAINYSTMAMHL